MRPTAFFKSLAGQIKMVKEGKPYVMFGDGNIASCKPISERDLASFIADCVSQTDKVNQMLPIGGPGAGFSLASSVSAPIHVATEVVRQPQTQS